VIECAPPEVIVEEVMIPIPEPLTRVWTNPAVPNSGDNADLLDWAQTCAVTNHMYEQQMKKLKELE
jgi:hypothetical protein